MSLKAQITAVDNTTDTLTVVAHGQVTGAGPAAIALGDLGVIPAGAAELTDYWLIVTGVDTFKIATSLANALANVPVNLTTNGSGTFYLEMGLPYRRNTTYAALSLVKSADLNDIQISIVSLNTNGGGRSERDFGIMAKSFIPANPATFDYGTYSAGDGTWIEMQLNETLIHDLQIDSGETITKIEFSLQSLVTAVSFDYKLRRRQIGSGVTGFADVTTGSVTLTGVTQLAELLPNVVVASGYVYQLYVKLTADASALHGRLNGASVYHKRQA
jgi:hypothetical protein